MKKYSVVIITSFLVLFCAAEAFAQVSTAIGNGENFYCYQDDDRRLILRTGSNLSIRRKRATRISDRNIRKNRRLARRAKRRLGDLELAAYYQALVAEWKHTKRDVRACWRETGDYTYNPGDGGGGGDNSAACAVAQNPASPSISAAAQVGAGDEVSARIIDGLACTVGSSPVVMVDINGYFTCTGTVVANDCVITAAHCFTGGTSGTSIRTGNGSVNAAAVYPHPSWDSSNSNPTPHVHDIAVIKLSGSAGTNIATINSTHDYQVGEAIVIAGYGRDNNNNYETLRAGTNTIGSQTNSEGIHMQYTGNGDSDTCNGDSGGPVFVNRGGNYKLAGATSWGNAGCTAVDNAWFSNINDSESFISTYCPGLF